MQPIICGVDAGTYIGLAIIDLNKNVLFLGTYYHSNISDIAKTILKYGDPIAIGSDVPNNVLARRLAYLMNCRLIHPSKPLKVKWKKSHSQFNYKNDHERDALSSAFYAAGRLSKLITKVKSENKENVGEIIERIIKKKSPNIKQAYRDFLREKNVY